MPLGLKININGEEKDLDDIFLKIADYNTNQSNYQTGEAVQLTLETGIKYIDETGEKNDIIYRYIGYDSEGYKAANYEANANRIDASQMANITDKNENNLVDLFYQLGTKKMTTNDYITHNINIHNRNKRVDFQMTFLQSAHIVIVAKFSTNTISMTYGSYDIITINQNSVTNTLPSETIVKITDKNENIQEHTQLNFFINGNLKLSLDNNSSGEISYSFKVDV
jgi:hypothetical protein